MEVQPLWSYLGENVWQETVKKVSQHFSNIRVNQFAIAKLFIPTK